MTREEKLQKAHQMFDNRNLLTELKWQREYFKRGYISNQEELFNLWIFDECIKALKQEPSKPMVEIDLYSVIKQKYIEREVLDKIRAEIEAKCCITVGRENDGAITLHDVFEILDKYKGESEE